jgi:hypothetical protein
VRMVYCKTHGKQTEKQAKKNGACITCSTFVKKPFKAKRPGES